MPNGHEQRRIVQQQEKLDWKTWPFEYRHTSSDGTYKQPFCLHGVWMNPDNNTFIEFLVPGKQNLKKPAAKQKKTQVMKTVMKVMKKTQVMKIMKTVMKVIKKTQVMKKREAAAKQIAKRPAMKAVMIKKSVMNKRQA